jgi:hypothetical protein
MHVQQYSEKEYLRRTSSLVIILGSISLPTVQSGKGVESEDLIVDEVTLRLSGNHGFEDVHIVNGSTI